MAQHHCTRKVAEKLIHGAYKLAGAFNRGKIRMVLRNRKLSVCVGLVVLLVAGAGAATSDQVRQATLDYIRKNEHQAGIEKLSGYVQQQMDRTTRISTRELGQLAVTAECVRFLQLAAKGKADPETAAWLLSSNKRLHQFIDTLESTDRLKECFAILAQLRKHDPAGSEEYFDLMLAIAVVLDQQGNKKMHGQMGRNLLPVDRDPIKIYNYFKALYASGKAKMNYGKLTATELVFVVVPAPISELQWAQDNVNGSLGSWGKKYSEIEYDHDRLTGSRFSWDHGEYKLCDIETLGGICVDQAYYAVMTARAHGIPALYFRGSGKSANHAWFAFMKGQGDWVLDIGRYQNDAYTTGYAINPQTVRQMTDHDVEYTKERSSHSKKAAEASAYLSIAEVLIERDPDRALQSARTARDLQKKSLRPWEIERRILVQQKDYDGLIKQYYEKKDAFRKYPDILVATAQDIAKELRKGGRGADADKLIKNVAGAVDDDRDDLARSFESQRIQQIIDSGDMKKARKELEEMLDEHKDQGNKITGLIRQYIKVTKDSGQTRDAVKFLEDYIEDLIEEYNFPTRYEENLLKLLLAAYENDGETKDAAKLKKRIERLQLQQNM